MTSFFVSSVISGFVEYRSVAKTAIELQVGKPVMSENFGARSYSSEKACLLEIEQSDVFILILGADYGFVTPDGTSVTQAEFEYAKSLNKRILVFIQKIEMDAQQAKFKAIVESYSEGFFRASFSNPSELKDEIIKGIALLNASLSANSEAEFVGILNSTIDSQRRSRSDSPHLRISFLPQPLKQVHLPKLDEQADEYFTKMCEAKLGVLREGYKTIEDGNREGFMGIETRSAKLKVYENGLIVIEVTNLVSSTHTFATFTISPNRVLTLCKAAFDFIDVTSAWCQIGLFGINNKSFMELDEGKNTFSHMGGNDTNEVFANKLFQPINQSSYESWVVAIIESWQRKLS